MKAGYNLEQRALPRPILSDKSYSVLVVNDKAGIGKQRPRTELYTEAVDGYHSKSFRFWPQNYTIVGRIQKKLIVEFKKHNN